MKIKFETLYKGSNIELMEGNAMHWLKLAWKYVDKESLNEYDTAFEKILVYKRFYALICFYCDFVKKLDDSYSEKDNISFEISFDDLDSALKDYYNSEMIDELIYDEYYTNDLANMLAEQMGISTLFASLYFARNYNRFSLENYENDDFYYSGLSNEDLDRFTQTEEAIDYEFRKRCQQGIEDDTIYDIILNEIEVDKIIAYEWLCEYLGR